MNVQKKSKGATASHEFKLGEARRPVAISHGHVIQRLFVTALQQSVTVVLVSSRNINKILISINFYLVQTVSMHHKFMLY